jgi:WD40 repeat protein
VYVYDAITFQLLKLLTFVDHNISAIAWEPTYERYLAQASMDKKLIIWDLDSESIKFEVQFQSHVVHIDWSQLDLNQIFLLHSNSEIRMLDLAN